MMKFYLEFRHGSTTYKCHLLNNVLEDANDRENTIITFNRELENFYKHDTDLIFNFKLDEFKEINGDYAKALYMFYLTNRYSDAVNFNVIDLMKRLNVETHNRSKVIERINKAHDELNSINFLKAVEPIKEGRELTGYKVEFKKRREKPLSEPKEKEINITDDLSLCDEELPF